MYCLPKYSQHWCDFSEVVDRIVVVDISPVNRKFDVTDATEWNMSHFFHMLKSVQFPENLPTSKVRQEVDAQLAKRIKASYRPQSD